MQMQAEVNDGFPSEHSAKRHTQKRSPFRLRVIWRLQSKTLAAALKQDSCE